MALVRIEIHAGQPADYRMALVEGVREALMQALGIPAGDVLQRVYELDDEHFITPPGVPGSVTVIEIALSRGYSVAAKEHLFRALAANLRADPGIAARDLRIVLNDPPLQNWGIRGDDPSYPASPPDAQDAPA